MALKVKRNLPNTDLEIEQYLNIKAFRFDSPSRIYLELQTKQKETSDDILESWDEPMTLEEIGEKGDISMERIYAALKARDEYADAKDA